jgi:hypothetical protein
MVFFYFERFKGDVIIIKYSECCEDIITAKIILMFMSEVYDKLLTAVLPYITFY